MLRRFFAFFALVALCGLSAAVACNGDDTTALIAPITGVAIRAETLTAGLGCGTSPPQIYKYAALVYGFNGVGTGAAGVIDPAKDLTVPIAAGVFDCFSDGAFVSLPASNGSLQFRIELFVYVAPAYQRAQALLDGVGTTFGAFDPSVEAQLISTNPTWRTTCHATQQDLVEVLAVCDPLATGEAGSPSVIQIPTDSFARSDGSKINCEVDDGGTIPTPDAGDAGDAGDDASDDAGDAGDADAAVAVVDAGKPPTPAPSYRTVRVRARVGEQVVGSTVDLACPSAFLLSPATPLTTYTFDVGLIDSNGKTVGSTTCSSAAEPGSASTATCLPIP